MVQVVSLVGGGGEFGGPTTVAVGLTRELSSRGHRVTLLALRVGDVGVPDGVPSSGWKVFPARRFVPGVGMLGLFNLRLAWCLWRSMRRADIVHLHAGRDLVSLVTLLLAALTNVPVVAQTHGMVRPRSSPLASLFDRVFVPLLRRARVVSFLTPDEEVDLRALLGSDAPLSALSNGLPLPPQPASRDPSDTTPTVVFASRLHPVKRVVAFAEAARILLDAGVDADFVVYGPDQGQLDRLLEIVAEMGSSGRLRYGGALGHDETLTAMATGDVFVLPSSIDWAPMALLEAMSLGLACVCTHSCGLAPAIERAEAGLVIDGDVVEIAEAVRRLVEDPALARRLGENARDLVRREFSLAAIVDDLLRCYVAVLSPATTSAATRSRPASAERKSEA
ncbi:Glycosyltransferase involved in cell wall bisynthesis [Nocardioides sp. AX2bis]|nr:Glycosyltransferase involved in cell wall bisynthesis [Nocardioides sp. AX2bis]